MKWIIGLCLWVLWPAFVLAGPVLDMPAEKVTYGMQVVSGAKVTVTFSLTNSGDSELNILKVVPDCGCSAAYFDRMVPPGEKGRIDLVIDTTGLAGRIKKRAMVKTNDPANKGFIIEAELEVIPVNSGS